MLIRVVDLETCGLTPPTDGGSGICEIGWSDLRLNGDAWRVADGGSMLVNPGRPIPPETSAVHHIVDADVAGSPIWSEVQQIVVTPEVDAYAAHNASFERAFLGEIGPWICSYKVALRLWPDSPAHGNQVLRYALGLGLPKERCEPVHRAGPDAFVTAHLLARALGDGRASLDDMLRWSSGPALFPRVPVGMHRGKAWPDVPSDYLKWVADKSDLDRDIKANARHHLKLRDAA